MSKTLNRILALTTLTLLIAGACLAQGQGGGQSSAFREEHKYTFQLMQTVRHIGDIDKDPKYTLSPAQAKQVLAVMKPIRAKSKLTQDQAKQALKDLKKIFTVAQLNAMAKIKTPAGQHRMGSGGPGGPGGNAQGNRPRMDAAAMKDFNPFYTKAGKSDPGAMGRAKRTNDTFSALEKKAKQTKAAPSKGKAKK